MNPPPADAPPADAPRSPSSPEPPRGPPPSPPAAVGAEARQAGILVVGQVLASAADALALVFLVRLLPRADVGVWAGVMLVHRTLVTLLAGGFPRTVLFALADADGGARAAIMARLDRLMLGWGAGLSAILLGVAYGARRLADGAPDPIWAALPFVALLPLFELPARLTPNLLLAEGRARASAGVSVLTSIASTSALLIPPLLGWGVEGLLVATTGVGALRLAGHLAVRRWLHGALRPTGGLGPWALVRFSLPLGLTDAINILNARLDLWLVLAFFGAEVVAVYKVGAWQIPLVTSLAYSIGTAYLPRLRRSFSAGRPREAIALWQASIDKVALVSVPIGAVFMVGATDFVRVAFGEAFVAAAPVLRAYAFLTGARVAAFGAVMVAAGRPGYVVHAALFTLGSNLLVSLPLTLALGTVGPALGTAIAFVPTVAFYCWFIARAAGRPLTTIFPLRRVLRVVAVVLGPALLAGGLRSALPLHPLVGFGLTTGTILLGFSALGTATRLITPDDWRYAASWVSLRILREPRTGAKPPPA